MSDHEWLKNLKPGDEVAVRSGGFDAYYKFLPVLRLTATQILVGSAEYPTRFDRETGREKTSHRPDYLHQATPELKAELAKKQRHRELAARLGNVQWRRQTIEVMEQIVAILDAESAPLQIAAAEEK